MLTDTNILLSIVGFIGAMGVKQLMKIAQSVSEIKTQIGVLATDHSNLKEDHHDLKHRVAKLESTPTKHEYTFKDK